MNYILEVPHAFDKAFCEEVMEFRKSSTTLDKYEDLVFWNYKDINLDWKKYSDEFDKRAKPIIDSYFKQFNDVLKFEEIFLAGFGVGRQGAGAYDLHHYDTNIVGSDGKIYMRPFVLLIYLNEGDFNGGQLVFPAQKRVIEPAQGKVVIFPCSYMFPHKVASISEGDRFSARLNYYLNITPIDQDLDSWDYTKNGIQKQSAGD
jgi:hypothetical protein